jgi:hypothetical protein
VPVLLHGVRAVLCCVVFLVCVLLGCCVVLCCVQLVDICRTQLDAWSAAPGPIDLAKKGKDLSFEFSTQLLVSFEQGGGEGGRSVTGRRGSSCW